MLLTVATTLKCLVAYLLQILRPCTTENSKLPPPFNKGSIVERQQQTLSFRLSPPGNEWLTRMDAPTFFQCRLYCYSARRSRKRSLMWLRGLALSFVIVSCVDRFFRCPRGIHIAQPPPSPHTTLLRQHLHFTRLRPQCAISICFRLRHRWCSIVVLRMSSSDGGHTRLLLPPPGSTTATWPQEKSSSSIVTAIIVKYAFGEGVFIFFHVDFRWRRETVTPTPVITQTSIPLRRGFLYSEI